MQLYYNNNNIIFLDALQDAVTGSYINDATLKFTLCYTGTGYEGEITNITSATPGVVTSAAHGLSNGDQVAIRKVNGVIAAIGIQTVANKTANTFEMSGTTTTGTFIDTSATDDPAKWYLAVPGLVQLSMSYVSSSNGRYAATVPGTAFITSRVRYKGYVEATDATYKNKLNFWLDVDVVDRT